MRKKKHAIANGVVFVRCKTPSETIKGIYTEKNIHTDKCTIFFMECELVVCVGVYIVYDVVFSSFTITFFVYSIPGTVSFSPIRAHFNEKRFL